MQDARQGLVAAMCTQRTLGVTGVDFSQVQ
jgi:hypothetical protein